MGDLLLQRICGQRTMKENDIWGNALYEGNKRPHGISAGIAQAAYSKLNGESGEVDLLVTVIVRAAKDRDLEWLHGEQFEHYCDLMGLDPTVIRAVLIKAIDYIDYGIGDIDLEGLRG